MEKAAYVLVVILIVGSSVYYLVNFLSAKEPAAIDPSMEDDVLVKYPLLRYVLGIGLLVVSVLMFMKIIAAY